MLNEMMRESQAVIVGTDGDRFVKIAGASSQGDLTVKS